MGKPPVPQLLGEELLGQKAHVLGEHGEQAAHEELGHQGLVVAVGFQLLGQVGQVPGDLARDLGRVLGRIEVERIVEEAAQGIPVLAEVTQEQAVVLRVGEGLEVAAAVEGRVEVDAADGGLAAFVGQLGLALEDVEVAFGVASGRVGRRHAQDRAQVGEKEILVGPLRRSRSSPLRDERVQVLAHRGAL
jgi:hypothetical protein